MRKIVYVIGLEPIVKLVYYQIRLRGASMRNGIFTKFLTSSPSIDVQERKVLIFSIVFLTLSNFVFARRLFATLLAGELLLLKALL